MAERSRADRSRSQRLVLRALGAVLLVAGVVLVVLGGMRLADDFGGGGFGAFALLAPGLFLCVFGLGALNAGFLGAQARYVGDEAGPSLRSALGREPVAGPVARPVAGRDEGTVETTAAGPYCRSCGVRNDESGRFCSSCGSALA